MDKNIDTNKLIEVGIVNPVNNDKWHQRNIVYSDEGIICTLTATMHKDPPRVFIGR